MKKILLASLSLAVTSIGFSADSLIAGFNFGQFNGPGFPSTDGQNFDSAGSIAAGFQGTSEPASGDSGVFRANNNIGGAYDPGYATLYWDGTNGSGTFENTQGVQIAVVEKGTNGVNNNTANGGNLFAADTNGAGLSFNVANTKWSIVTNTVGYADTAADNLSFAAFSPAGATVQWFLNGSNIAFASSTITATTDYVAYVVDLPIAFYGQSSVSIQGSITSGSSVTLDNIQLTGAVSAIPEPSTFAVFGGLATLAVASLRRRRVAV